MKLSKTKINILILLIVSLLFTMTFSYAKYASNLVKDYYLKSKGFYFYSDYLDIIPVNNSNNAWDYEAISFNIRNNLNDSVASDYDISYTASCSIEGVSETDVVCNMYNSSTDIYNGIISSVKACINETSDLVDVSSYTEEECNNGGYLYKSIKNEVNLYFDIDLVNQSYIITDLIVDVDVVSTSPYSKTISGKFYIHKDNDQLIVVNMNDYSNYDRLNLYNSSDTSKCIQVSWNTSKFLIDNPYSDFPNYLTDTNNYINEFKIMLEANTSISYVFYKNSFSSTYTIDDFNILEDCTIE
ncbi:MAG: hypothetical protein PHD02_02060 [Bacilli bacterium]|nr:hypothetical protein [Bacilli bacterium]